MNSADVARDSTEACRIVIVDDHAIMRDGLTALLDNEPDLQVVGSAGDGKAAVEAVAREKPALVVIDLSMPRTDGAQAIRIIKRKFAAVRVVVLTFHKEDAHIHAALQAGADGYVLKDDGRGELLSAVRNVAAGKSYLSPEICDRVVSGYLHGAAGQTPSWELLNTREREVLKLIAEGYKNREIAEYLSLSVKTIEKHRANLMRKLDLHSVSEVTTYAIANGLLAQ
jgi:DNA-binding NarL/FixJ family response regulator